MEEIVKGIVLQAKDYKEKDKIITLFSVEKGVISLLLRGVKSPNAKLKYAKALFTFGEYIIVSKNSLPTIIGCDVIESFAPLSYNADKYLEACEILKITKSISKPDYQDIPLFFKLVNSLKTISFEENVENGIVLAKFLIDIFQESGYKLSLKQCSVCGGPFTSKRYLLLDTGEVVCSGCKIDNSLEIPPEIHTNLRIISCTSYDKLNSLKLSNINETLEFLKINFLHRFDIKLQFYS